MLFLAPVVPSDRGNGLAMRTGFFLDAYARHFAIDVAIVPVATGSAELSEFVRARARRATILPLPSADTHFKLVAAVVEPWARLDAFLRYGKPSLTSRLTVELTRAVATWVGDEFYSVIHVSRLYLAQLAAPWMGAGSTRPRMIIDCDEDDAQAYGRLAALEHRRGNADACGWGQAEADGFARLAAEWLPRFDLCLAASRVEARSLEASVPDTSIAVVPNVTPTAVRHRIRSLARRRARTVMFVGTMGYAPNADGILWFASCVWPLLRRKVPFALRLLVVGGEPPERIMRLHHRLGIVITGRVDDVSRLYRRADITIVPVRAGGGTRIKLLEAASYGVPVVSTGFGVQGTTFRNGHDILVADDAPAFARACALLLMDRSQADRIAMLALQRVRLEYDAKVWSERLIRWVAGPPAGLQTGCNPVKTQQEKSSNA